MRKSQFIFVLMLSTSFATMARADTSKDNCERVAGEGNCHAILNNPDYPTEGYSDTTYYALSGPEDNQTMTIYGTTESGNTAATVPNQAFYDADDDASTFPGGVTSLKTSGNVNIGDGAFAQATGLTSIDLTGVQTIGVGAFEYATKLTSIVISDSLLDDAGHITGIDPDAFFGSGLNTIYCPKDNDCGDSFAGLSKTPRIISYSIENGQIKAGGKTYASLNDLASGNHIVKRIYTIDEANEVAGKVNSVKIRYR